jgi:hypothetical protein
VGPDAEGARRMNATFEDVRELLARFARVCTCVGALWREEFEDCCLSWSMAPHWPRGVPHGDAKGRLAKRSECAGRWASHNVAAGSEIVPENTLKVETRVPIRYGLLGPSPGSGH